MEDIFAGLNQAQLQAVENIQGPSLVIAGAGSGKTRVLTCRIANLLKNNVPSYKILALTFTNKAAKEMKERISLIVGEDVAKDLWMGTFHSVFAKILRFEAASIGFSSNFTIYDTQDQRSLIGKIITDLKLDKDLYKPAAVAAKISKAKNNLVTAQAYAQNTDLIKQDTYNKMPDIHKIYVQYQNRCRKSDAMDFDDLLMYTNILFRDNQDVVAKYQNRFQYLLVDEYQDTNFSQYIIIKKLAAPENNVCVVGDDAQSIYSFRGAKIENILNFSKDYPQYKMFKLEQNYRSTQTIVNAANSIIAKNTKQIKKKTFSELEVGEQIQVKEYRTDIEEGFEVAREISELTQGAVEYHDVAILYRTNAQSRILEEALNKMRIPCKIHGGVSFFQRKEIKDILSYVRVCVNPKDEEALGRVINYPTRGIGQTTIDRMLILAQQTNITFWDVICNIEFATDVLNKGTITKIVKFRELMKGFINDLNNADAYSLLNRIVESTGLYQLLQADTSIEGKNRFDNMQELLNGVKEFVEQEEEISLSDYLEKIALLTDIDSDGDAQNKVTLMTVHSAKGLEFEHCFLVGLEETLFPSLMSGESPKDIEEERRLFYVALTRAKQTAKLTYATSRRKWGNLQTASISRFITEIDPAFLNSSVQLYKPSSTTSTSNNSGPSFGNFGKPKSNAISNTKTFSGFKPKNTNPTIPKVPEFEPDNPRDITAKNWVLHSKFGKGYIDEIQGVFPDSTAIITFEHAGQKKLLLKFAKLKQITR